MKRFLKIFIPLLILGALVYQFREILVARFLPPVPCSQPIPYTLGTFDTQFGISKSYFLSALADAETIWEKPKGDYLGRQLFTYASTDSDSTVLKINLVYDYRQQATSKLASLGIVVQDNKASYDTLKTKFTALQSGYNTQKSAFDARVAAHTKLQQAYEAEVSYWNGKGGAPEADYNKVEADRLALNADAQDLQATQTHINSMADEINALVVALNRLVATLNLSVDKFNTTNDTRGESFEEGVYSTNGLNRQIDIYEFSSRDKLVRVLAHELGHALGLDHVDDPKAIMYKLNQGSNEALTATDLNALKTKCAVK